MKYFNDKTQSALILIVLILGALYLASKPTNSISRSSSSKTPEVGQPCDLLGNPDLDTNGLQCYYYGEAPEEGRRKGIWIDPELPMPGDDGYYQNFYQDFQKPWKKYTSPDNSFSFEYPSTWEINALNWKDKMIFVLMGKPEEIPSTINIGLYSKKEFNFDEIEKLKNDPLATYTEFDRGDVRVTRFDMVPKINITPAGIYEVLVKGDKVLAVNAEHFNMAIPDFGTEALLRSIELK